MRKILLTATFLLSQFFCCISNGQIKSVNKDSEMEKSIRRLVEHSATKNSIVPEDFKTYLLLFVLNFDSLKNGTFTLSIDTVFDSKLNLDIPGKTLFYNDLISDSSRYKEIISKYHPSKSLSIIIPLFRSLYPSDSHSVINYDDFEYYMIHIMSKIKECNTNKRELYFMKPISSGYGIAVH